MIEISDLAHDLKDLSNDPDTVSKTEVLEILNNLFLLLANNCTSHKMDAIIYSLWDTLTFEMFSDLWRSLNHGENYD